MKTFEDLKEDLIEHPGDYNFDEDDLDEVIDLFEQYDLNESDFTNHYDRDFDEDDLVDFLSTYMTEIDTDDIGLYNDYIDDNNYEEHLYYMNELDDLLSGYSPTEIIDMVMSNDDFSTRDEYFYFNGNGNLVSSDSVEEVADDVIGLNVFIKWIIEKDFSEFLDDIVFDVLKALYE